MLLFSNDAIPHRFLIVFVAASAFFSGVVLPSASTEAPRYHGGYACEGQLLRLSCGNGYKIHLVRANFGRFSIEQCNHGGNGNFSNGCMSPRSLRVMHSLCSDKERCQVHANQSVFGDPCPGTSKYLEAQYQCFPAEGKNSVEEKRSISPSTAVGISGAVSDAPQNDAPSNTDFAEPGMSPIVLKPNDMPRFTAMPVNSSLGALRWEDRSKGSPTDGENRKLPLRFAANRLSPSTSTSNRVPGGESPCPGQRTRSISWNWTSPGDVAILSCPQGSAPGSARWVCSGPLWETPVPDLSECRLLSLASALSRLNGASLDFTLNEVGTITSTKTLFGGDLRSVSNLLRQVANRLEGSDVNETTTTVAKVIGIGSDVIADAQAPSWNDLPDITRAQAATDLLLALEENAFTAADGLGEEEAVLVPHLNILMSAQKVRASAFPFVSFPTEEEGKAWTYDDGTSIHIPGKALVYNSRNSIGASPNSVNNGAAVKIVFFLMNNLDKVLAPAAAAFRGGSAVVGSRVVSASIDARRHVQLAYPVSIVFRNLVVENVTKTFCVFWDYTSSSWSEEGCHVVRQNRTYTVCECSHLTHFALLVSFDPALGNGGDSAGDSSKRLALIEWLTSAAVTASIAGFLAAFVLTRVWKDCRGDKWSIYQNFCACVFIAQLIFVLGVRETWNSVGCGVVAAFLHYFFLAAFIWGFLQEFDLYMSLVELAGLESRCRMMWYAMVAYGFPLVIVGVSASVEPAHYFYPVGRFRDYCWIGARPFTAYTFAGPLGVVLIATVVIVIMSMLLSSSNRSKSSKNRYHQSSASPPMSLTLSSPASVASTADSLEGMLEDRRSALFSTTRKWIAWTWTFSLFFLVTWVLGFLSVSTFAPAGTRKRDVVVSSVNICFAVCQVLLGGFAVLLTAVLAGKLEFVFRRKFPFCRVCLNSSGAEDHLASMRFTAGGPNGGSGMGDDSGNGSTMMTLGGHQRGESSRRKRSDTRLGDRFSTIPAQGSVLGPFDPQSGQLEPGVSMNHYITTLKSTSGGMATPCIQCSHPYCDAPMASEGGHQQAMPMAPVGTGMQLPLPPLPTAVAPRPYCPDPNGERGQGMQGGMRPSSPGYHTYMELELNADGSTIYAEIDHTQAKFVGPGGQRVESGYEYARSGGPQFRRPVQTSKQQCVPPPPPVAPVAPVVGDNGVGPVGNGGAFLLNNLNRSPVPRDPGQPSSASSSFSSTVASYSPDSNLMIAQQQQRRSTKRRPHRNVPGPHSRQSSQDAARDHSRQRSHSGNLSRPPSPGQLEQVQHQHQPSWGAQSNHSSRQRSIDAQSNRRERSIDAQSNHSSRQRSIDASQQQQQQQQQQYHYHQQQQQQQQQQRAFNDFIMMNDQRPVTIL